MTTMDDARKLKIAGQFVSALPFSRALGLELVSLEGNVCEMRMPYREELVGQPDTGVIAGGAVSALMDTCCGTAVLIHPEAVTGTATLTVGIDSVTITSMISRGISNPRAPRSRKVSRPAWSSTISMRTS